jgi:hypothetical protein
MGFSTKGEKHHDLPMKVWERAEKHEDVVVVFLEKWYPEIKSSLTANRMYFEWALGNKRFNFCSGGERHR